MRHAAGGRDSRWAGFFRPTVGHCQSFGFAINPGGTRKQWRLAPSATAALPSGECAKASNALSPTNWYTIGEVQMLLARSVENHAIGKITLSILAVKAGRYIFETDLQMKRRFSWQRVFVFSQQPFCGPARGLANPRTRISSTHRDRKSVAHSSIHPAAAFGLT